MYPTYVATSLTLLATFLPTIYAQTFTSCDPLNRTDCPLDTALGRANYSINFDTEMMSTKVWNATAGNVNYGSDGAEFTINARGDSPTVQTNFYLFFGQVEVIMRAASGQGIISSIVLESDDLDEVDWEFMGGNTTHVETNYFGKGNTTSFDRAIYYPVETPQETWHNYTTNWSNERLEWYIDGNLVRTLEYADANGGYDFPQTPMNVRLGIWAGGDSAEPKGTIEWAGGETNYDDAPFTMLVQSVRVSDASRGTQYKYGDTSGSWQSIQVLNDTKAISLDGNNSESTTQDLQQKWNGLSRTAKIAIAAGVAGVLLVSIIVFAICCIKQRKAGRRERAIDDAAFEKQRAEVLAYRADMSKMRSEKMAMGPSSGINPAYVQAVQSLGSMQGSRPRGPEYEPSLGAYRNEQGPPQRPGYAPSMGSYESERGYAQGVNSSGGGRGYQRY